MARATPMSTLAAAGLILSATTLTGCAGMFGSKSAVITPRNHLAKQTVVRAYNLDGLGLNDAPPQELQVLMTTIQDMVVTDRWERSDSAIQVFGMLMTVRTTPDNHLLIEDYLERVRRITSEPHYSMKLDKK